MKSIAVYKENGKLFAVFTSMNELVRVLRVNRADVFDCLGFSPCVVAKSHPGFNGKRSYYKFVEGDETNSGRC